MDIAIAEHMKKNYNLMIGERTAEDVKIAIGSVNKKSEGLILWKRLDWFAMDLHSNKNGYQPPVKEWRTGTWNYWDEDGNSIACAESGNRATIAFIADTAACGSPAFIFTIAYSNCAAGAYGASL